MKQSVQVTILGQQYVVRSEAPPEEVRKIAAYVDGMIAEVAASGKTADTLGAAVLAMLNLAGAHLRLCEMECSGRGEVEARLQRLLERLEAACS